MNIDTRIKNFMLYCTSKTHCRHCRYNKTVCDMPTTPFVNMTEITKYYIDWYIIDFSQIKL